MPKRRVLWLQWYRPRNEWLLFEAGVPLAALGGVRRNAEHHARQWCRSEHERGSRIQLKVKNKTDGRISFEATYGADPRRYRG